MKITRLGVGLSLVLTASLLSSHVASADTRPSSPGALSSKAESEKYKEDFLIYRQALKQYEDERRAINIAFKIAIERALSDSKEPESSTLSQVQKRQNSALKRNAVAMAISIRDAAIASLGEIPTPPVEPMKLSPKSRKGTKPPR